jgi:hypothetical protein
MKLKVRALNDEGITEFESWLKNPLAAAPTEILTDPRYSEEIADSYDVDTSQAFETSYQLGKYLHHEVFKQVKNYVHLSSENGIWAWISLAFIDSLLARSTSRKGRPLSSPHYIDIATPQGRRLGYRLIARTAWELVRLHGNAAEIALGSKRSPWGEMAEQMTSRQEIFSHPSFWQLAYHLYRSESGEVLRGATSQRPEIARRDPKNVSGRGSVRRLPFTFRQFDRTYNMRRMSLDNMLSVLPKEYSKWIPKEV